jgi:exodeoxyribonuclease VII large subunit
MSDLLDDAPEPGANAPEFTVSEISGAVKRSLEDQFGRVRVRGEVGRVSRPRSGHVYLDLKDDRAVLSAVIWKGALARLDAQPEEGDAMIAEGRITTFPGQSKYQMVIDKLAYAGEGALLARLEKLRRALAGEGLFDDARKRAIPFLPRVVGVVTSPTGAVIRDILHRLADRFGVHVLVWPVVVQGQGCAAQVAAAVRGFNALGPGGAVPRPDVLIVARGGGSVEDLWGFNEEVVVRAVADSAIPVISAVGHETDHTLIDHAADRRAPTPTAAAEMAVPVRRDLIAGLRALEERRAGAMARALEARRVRLRDLSRLLPSSDEVLGPARQRLDRAAERLPRALSALASRRRLDFARGAAGRFGPALVSQPIALRRGRLADRAARLLPALRRGVAQARTQAQRLGARLSPRQARQAGQRGRTTLAAASARLDRAALSTLGPAQARLARAGALLETLSYKATLSRGFAVVRGGADGRAITRAEGVAPGAALSIEFADGVAQAVAGRGPAPRTVRPTSPKGGQGRLF